MIINMQPLPLLTLYTEFLNQSYDYEVIISIDHVADLHH